MSILPRLNSLLGAWLLLFSVGCELDKAAYLALYNKSCSESATVPFETLGAQSTCNGMPILIALASTQEPLVAKDAPDLFDFLITIRGLDPNLKYGERAQTPLMIALENANWVVAQQLIEYSNLLQTDGVGRNYLHYIALNPEALGQHLIRAYGPTGFQMLAETIDTEGLNPLDLGFKSANYGFVWTMFGLLRNTNLLSVDPFANGPLFLFTPSLDRATDLLPTWGQQITRPFTGQLGERFVQDYSLIHFAAENHMRKTVKYWLDARYATDTVSSEGAPLALSLRSYALKPKPEGVAVIELLLGDVRARKSKGALAAALRTGQREWVQSIIHGGGGLDSYENLLFSNCSSTTCTASAPMDLARNHPWILQLSILNELQRAQKEVAPELINQVRREVVPATNLNSLGQSFSSLAFYLVSPELDASLAAAVQFKDLIDWAESNDQLNLADQLGMKPIHYWLANPWRHSQVGSKSEIRNFRHLLRHTKNPLTLNVNQDSILSLAVRTGNLALIQDTLARSPKLKKLLKVANLQGKTPTALANDLGYMEIYEYLQSVD